MKAYFHWVAVLATLTDSTVALAAPSEFNESVTFSKYEIVGQLAPQSREGKIENTLLVSVSNPRSGLWIASTEKIGTLTARVRTGKLSQCRRIPENERQTITNRILPALVQLPLIEAALQSESKSSEADLENLRVLKVISRFLNAVDEDAPWYACK